MNGILQTRNSRGDSELQARRNEIYQERWFALQPDRSVRETPYTGVLDAMMEPDTRLNRFAGQGESEEERIARQTGEATEKFAQWLHKMHGAESAEPYGDKKTEMAGQILQGVKAHYQIVSEVMRGESVQYYLCRRLDATEGEREFCFCAIADTKTDESLVNAWKALTAAKDVANDVNKSYDEESSFFRFYAKMDREELRKMWRRGRAMEVSDDTRWTDENPGVNYLELFPIVVERLTWQDQWSEKLNRSVMILETVPDPEGLMTLEQIVQRGYRVDLKTSAWIMSKLLKLVLFYRYHRLRLGGFLIGPVTHDLVYLDWSQSWASENAEVATMWQNVREAAYITLTLLDARKDRSGEAVKYIYPYEATHKEQEYVKLLSLMATLNDEFRYQVRLTYDVHRIFYEAVEEAWGKESRPEGLRFYPFKTLPREKPKDG